MVQAIRPLPNVDVKKRVDFRTAPVASGGERAGFFFDFAFRFSRLAPTPL
jgi:hypothetical protein